MKSIILALLLGLTLAVTAFSQQVGPPSSKNIHTFGWKDQNFLLDGKPFQIISGDMHYARVPREYWRDRMKKMKAMGLNALTTYVFWNLHEPRPGKFDFSGNLDLAAYLKMAQEEGLRVILRPGPYICTEWDFGGLPGWLLADPEIKVRTGDRKFLKAAERYMKEVGKQVASMEVSKGGPIIMTQIENEYGSFGSDKDYLKAVRRMIRDAGFSGTLFTSDGPEKLAEGTLPDELSVINFGAKDSAEKKFATFDKFRQNVPRMCGELWVGWFDAWGAKHETVPAAKAAETLDWMLSRNISVSIYMFHGGSSFGFMAGANKGKTYTPDISSYDYDSPLDEAGRPTEKYYAIQAVIKKHLPAGTVLPQMPEPLPIIEIPRLELNESANFSDAFGKPVKSVAPQPMEMLGQNYGLILYRKKLNEATTGTLEITGEVRDYAVVSQGGKIFGTLDRRLKQTSLPVDLKNSAPLDILIENLGRVNYGPNMLSERKGIIDKVLLNNQELQGWEIYTLPLENLSKLKFTKAAAARSGVHFKRGVFQLNSVGDSYFDMRGWGKGYVWVNGHNLGRFWRIGPQQSLFVPAGWLKKGRNEVIALEFEDGRSSSIQGIKELVFDTPLVGGSF